MEKELDVARRFLGGLFETKKANPKDAPLRAAGRALSNGNMPLGIVGPWDMEKAVKDGLEKVGMVFRCVDAIAQTQSRIPMDIRKIERGVSRDRAKVVDDMDLWRLLNFRANSYESSAQFRYRLSAALLLSRRGAFVEMVPGTNGKPAELHLLSPGLVEPIPDARKFVSGYQIMRGDYVVDTVEPERVCWIKIKPHPMDPYSQLTPLMASGLAVETDYLARAFNRNFLMNDGRPGMLVTVNGKLSEDDADELKARFSGGISVAGRTSVIEAEGLQVADLSSNPRDVQWAEMIKGSKEDIQLAFGVPESVMGNASGRTFDNADAERENFYVDTIQPHCEPIAFGLDPITGDQNDDIVVAYDYSGIDVLQRQAARRREELRNEVAAGLRTIDSYMQEIGEEPWDVVGTRILWHTSGIAIAKNPDDQAAIMTLKPVGTPEDPNSSEQGALAGVRQGLQEADRQRTNTQQATALRQRALTLVKSLESPREVKADPKGHASKADAFGKLGRHPYLALRMKTEGLIEGHLEQWDARQENVVADRLGHVKFRKGTRHWDTKDGVAATELKAVDPRYAVDPDQWADDLVTGMTKTLRNAMMREARSALRNVKNDGIEIDITPRDLGALVNEAHKQAVDIVRTAASNQSQRLADAIADLDAKGASLKEIEQKVRAMTGTRAPWRKQLSVNVVTTAVEAARAAVYREAKGAAYTKTWRAENDARTRHTHRRADGQQRRVQQPFSVGGAKMQFPGDPSAPIHEVANCRCWLEYDLTETL